MNETQNNQVDKSINDAHEDSPPFVGLYPGAIELGKGSPLELVVCAQHFLAELHGRFPESQVGVTLHHILRMLKEVRREVEKAADVQ